MGGTKFCLFLGSKHIDFTDCVICFLKRLTDRGPNQLELDFELSFLDGDGSVIQSEIYLKKVYRKEYFDVESVLCAKKDEVFLHKKDLYIHDDTLTIRCRIWDSQEFIIQSGRCFTETRIGSECRSFVGTIDKFSFLKPRKKYPICIKSSSTEISDVSLVLSVGADGLLHVEIKSFEAIRYYRCKIFILDKFENKAISGQGEFRGEEPHCITLTLSKEYLVKNREYFLPNDKLTILCEVMLPGDATVGEMEYIFDCHDTEGVISDTRSTDVSSEEHHVENLTTLKDDLISLFREGIFSDTKLNTATETFSAHISVLSARSPVFKSMFTNDMKEKTNQCVDIDDLDADTVRRMLLFMYSDTVDDLDYNSAKSLYFAADKYNIISLRCRCSSFLKQKLLESNCCDVLLLADKHQDTDLKNAVQAYIAKNDEVVLFSNEWKDLEKNHSQLTTEVLRFMYLKNRRN
ncbi:TD and POZ domain-containing protein 3 [Araneus ventricosus]|uniref:TD and POZ domain-containing protein 3 n=1 Tax=Araneus ventricosus TaxID=182803 RepID=A0A4Y2PER9_ARAVE|nr:TD and POZ domain-containing protein 3 [Araneus ventricosus]